MNFIEYPKTLEQLHYNYAVGDKIFMITSMLYLNDS